MFTHKVFPDNLLY